MTVPATTSGSSPSGSAAPRPAGAPEPGSDPVAALETGEGDPAGEDRQPEGGQPEQEHRRDGGLLVEAGGGQAGDQGGLDRPDGARGGGGLGDGRAHQVGGDDRRDGQAAPEGLDAADQAEGIAEGDQGRPAEQQGELAGVAAQLPHPADGPPDAGDDVPVDQPASGRDGRDQAGGGQDAEPDPGQGPGRGQMDALPPAGADHDHEDAEQGGVHHGAGDRVDAGPGDGDGGVDALAFHEAGAEGQAANLGRGDPVHER